MVAFSQNVILAKARAMYGSRVTPRQYQDMLACHSVGEVAAYLKANTGYATVLRDINELTIHRGYLELLLRRKLYTDYASLSRYDRTVGMNLTRYLQQRGENEQLMACLRMLSAGRPEEFFFAASRPFAGQSCLDPEKMSRVRTYAELTELLRNTWYGEVLRRFPPGEDGCIRLTEIENALTTQLVQTFFHIIDHTHGTLREQLTDLFGTQVDAQNVMRMWRLKRYFHVRPDRIRANLLPSGRVLPQKTVDAMLAAPTAEEVMALFLATKLGRKLPETQRAYAYDLPHRAPYFNARHHIHFSTHPMVVMISYIYLSDVELENIVNIIEGIRYGLPPEELRSMLVLPEQ